MTVACSVHEMINRKSEFTLRDRVRVIAVHASAFFVLARPSVLFTVDAIVLVLLRPALLWTAEYSITSAGVRVALEILHAISSILLMEFAPRLRSISSPFLPEYQAIPNEHALASSANDGADEPEPGTPNTPRQLGRLSLELAVAPRESASTVRQPTTQHDAATTVTTVTTTTTQTTIATGSTGDEDTDRRGVTRSPAAHEQGVRVIDARKGGPSKKLRFHQQQ